MWFVPLIGFLLQVVGSFVGRVLLSMALGYVTYTGISTSLDYAKGQVMANMGALGSTVVGVLGLLQVGTSVNILVSALAMRLVLGGMVSGSIKKMVQK